MENKTKKIIAIVIIIILVVGLAYLFKAYRKVTAPAQNSSQSQQTNQSSNQVSDEKTSVSGQVAKIDGQFIYVYIKDGEKTLKYKIDSSTPVFAMDGMEKKKSGLPNIKVGQQVSVSYDSNDSATEIIIEKL